MQRYPGIYSKRRSGGGIPALFREWHMEDIVIKARNRRLKAIHNYTFYSFALSDFMDLPAASVKRGIQTGGRADIGKASIDGEVSEPQGEND